MCDAQLDWRRGREHRCSCQITYLNATAEDLTGWTQEEAVGHPIEDVIKFVDADTRVAAQNPMALTIREDKAVALIPNCVLVRRDGTEVSVEDSVAPIHDRRGAVTGAVMVFHDVQRGTGDDAQDVFLGAT